MKGKNILTIIAALAIPQIAGAIGSLFTFQAIPTWYATIIKPELAPPNWVFGPVWTTLFLLMGLASYLVWKRGWERRDVKIALSVYVVQLALNTIWSILFFGIPSPQLAFYEIVLLWLSIATNIVLFYRISKAAGLMLVPYIAWVSFAGYLNYSIWMLNG